MENSTTNITKRKGGQYMDKFIAGYDDNDKHRISIYTVNINVKYQ